MVKSDREFLIKISKKADKAVLLSTQALKLITDLTDQLIKTQDKSRTKKTTPKITANETIKLNLPVSSTNEQSILDDSTRTYVQFDTKEELSENAHLIMKLNKDIDDICRKLKVKQLSVTFRRP